ncbi:hypothetical protein B0H16DRAFT_1478337, partial [Mycena metata]
MAPLPKIGAVMQTRRAQEAISELPLAVTVLHDKAPELYAEMVAKRMTLHKDYKSVKCIGKDCRHCNSYYDHIDARRHTKRKNPESNVGSDALVALEIGESAIDVAFTLQMVLGYQDAVNTMAELAGFDAATELASCKRKLVAAETQKKQLEGQLKALRRQLNSQSSSTSQKRPAEEVVDPRAFKRLTLSEESPTAMLPVSAKDLADPEAVWCRLHKMPRPRPQDDYILLVQWLQHREVVNFRGIHLTPPNFTVDLRDARGYQQVFTRVPHQLHGSDPAPKRRRSRCVLALMRVLAVPGQYEALTNARNIHIHPTPVLEPCAFPETAEAVDLLAVEDIAALLGQRGLTVVDADDAWQFCHRFIRAEFGAIGESEYPDSDLVPIVTSEDGALKTRGLPRGSKALHKDVYPRTTLKEGALLRQFDINADGEMIHFLNGGAGGHRDSEVVAGHGTELSRLAALKNCAGAGSHGLSGSQTFCGVGVPISLTGPVWSETSGKVEKEGRGASIRPAKTSGVWEDDGIKLINSTVEFINSAGESRSDPTHTDGNTGLNTKLLNSRLKPKASRSARLKPVIDPTPAPAPSQSEVPTKKRLPSFKRIRTEPQLPPLYPPDSRHFSRPRQQYKSAYSLEPAIRPLMLFELRCGPPRSGRDVSLSSGLRVELWSPNSEQLPFYPGVPNPFFTLAIPLKTSDRFQDGHWGRFDPIISPQYFNQAAPWWPFLRRACKVEKTDAAFAAYEPLTAVWRSLDASTGCVPPEYVERLKNLVGIMQSTIDNLPVNSVQEKCPQFPSQ